MQCPIIGLHKQGCRNLMKLVTYEALLQEMEYFQIYTSTSGHLLPKLHGNLPFVSKVHYKRYLCCLLF